MRRNFFGIPLLVAGLLTHFWHLARTQSSSGGNSSPITVVIDAGHGGYDRGGIPGQRVSEKDMTLDVARRLKSVLAASGYRVVMTRDSDILFRWERGPQLPTPTATPFLYPSTSIQRHEAEQAA